MIIKDNEIHFRYLSHPSQVVIGEKIGVTAKVPLSSAKDSIGVASSLSAIESLGKSSAERLWLLFA